MFFRNSFHEYTFVCWALRSRSRTSETDPLIITHERACFPKFNSTPRCRYDRIKCNAIRHNKLLRFGNRTDDWNLILKLRQFATRQLNHSRTADGSVRSFGTEAAISTGHAIAFRTRNRNIFEYYGFSPLRVLFNSDCVYAYKLTPTVFPSVVSDGGQAGIGFPGPRPVMVYEGALLGKSN